MSKVKKLLTAMAAAGKIKMAIAKWPGKCSDVAAKFLKHKLVKGVLRRGHWIGPIAPGTMFANRAFTGHTWIEQADGTIVDPTRWVFEGVAPYIYIGKNIPEYYDLGGNILRSGIHGVYPTFKYSEETYMVPKNIYALLTDFLPAERLAPKKLRKVTKSQMFWLANINPSALGHEKTKEIYTWLKAIGEQALIPFDNLNVVCGNP